MKRKKQRVMWLMFAVVFWLAGAGMALAAGNGQVFLRVTPQSDGTVKVTCEGTGIGQITNGKFRVSYDSAQAALVNAQKGSVVNAVSAELNHKADNHEIVLAFASANSFSADGTYLDMTFRLVGSTKAEDLKLTVAVEEMANDGADVTVAIGDTRWETAQEPENPNNGNQGQNGGNNNNNNNTGNSGGNNTTTPSGKTNIASATVGKISNKAFNNKQKKPAVKVRVNGQLLKAGQDYTLTYRNNKKPGKATIVITGIGNYTGTKEAYFNIVPKKAAIKKVTSPSAKKIRVTWKRDRMATGYEIQYSTNKSFKKGVKKVTIKKNKITSRVIKKCKSGKKYYVRIRSFKKIDGKKVYGSYSKKLTVKVK